MPQPGMEFAGAGGAFVLGDSPFLFFLLLLVAAEKSELIFKILRVENKTFITGLRVR